MTTSALPGFQVTSSQNNLHNHYDRHIVIECGDKQEEEDSSTHCPDFALTVDREQKCLVRMTRNRKKWHVVAHLNNEDFGKSTKHVSFFSYISQTPHGI